MCWAKHEPTESMKEVIIIEAPENTCIHFYMPYIQFISHNFFIREISLIISIFLSWWWNLIINCWVTVILFLFPSRKILGQLILMLRTTRRWLRISRFTSVRMFFPWYDFERIYTASTLQIKLCRLKFVI